VILSGWWHGLYLRRESSLSPAGPPFIGVISSHFAVHQKLPTSELITWDAGTRLFVLQLSSGTVALPASPYGGQMGYRAVNDCRYELWAVGPHGPVLMSELEFHKEGK
jgi:hypothetical protein